MRLHFCISTGDRYGFMVKIILIRVFPPFLPLLNEIFVSAEKTTTFDSKMILCIKAVINMEDKCSLNLDKYHL